MEDTSEASITPTSTEPTPSPPEKPQNKAGQSVRAMAQGRRDVKHQMQIAGAVAMFVLIFWFLRVDFTKPGGLIALFASIVLMKLISNFLFGKIAMFEKLEKRAVRGAKAEEKIGEILESLGANFYVLHNVVTPYGDVDHLVFSRDGGLFLVETKAHGGRVICDSDGVLLVNGFPPHKDYIAQTRCNAQYLQHLLKIQFDVESRIVPILVFPNAFVEKMPILQGVTVTYRGGLVRLLQSNAQKPWKSEPTWDKRQSIEAALRRDLNLRETTMAAAALDVPYGV